MYFKAGDGRVPTSTVAANITDRPQFASNVVQPSGITLDEDIILEHIHSPRSSMPLKRNVDEGDDWFIDRETLSPVSPTSPRWEVSRRSRGRSSDLGITKLSSPILASVTVTRSRSVQEDGGLVVERVPGHRNNKNSHRRRELEWESDLERADTRHDVDGDGSRK